MNETNEMELSAATANSEQGTPVYGDTTGIEIGENLVSSIHVVQEKAGRSLIPAHTRTDEQSPRRFTTFADLLIPTQKGAK